MSKLYIVQRRTWFNECDVYEDEDCIKGGGIAVAAFTTRKAAKARAKELEKLARQQWSSPFQLMTEEVFDNVLGIETDALLAIIQEMGLEPPSEGKGRYSSLRNWARWYDDIAESLTPAQQEKFDELFKKIEVYEVVAVPVEEDE